MLYVSNIHGNMLPMVTTEKISIEYKQKEMRREPKRITTKKSTKHEEKSGTTKL